ncbi:MAG TPA: 4Fe-4S ferredoxin [Gammaproteobacteria bacterium]|nr:4Fe-4S ferredoxin [Gammaproteobacteria bacterium]
MSTDAAQKAAEFLGFNLPGESSLHQARLDALATGLAGEVTPTSLVSFSSSGVLAIIGPLPSALGVAEQLSDLEGCLIVATDGGEPGKTEVREVAGRSLPVVFGKPEAVEGFLGQFSITLVRDGAEVDLAKAMQLPGEAVDIVLDLLREPLIQSEILPPGYFAPSGDSEALGAACDAVQTLKGQFEKPQYVRYDPDICAHGARGINGCRRCLDVCPADALTTLGERISVETHLCHGMGSCSSACPTGALSYAYPNRVDTLNRLRRTITEFRAKTQQAPEVAFFGGEGDFAEAANLLSRIPDQVIPWRCEEVGTAGPEIWLSAIAYGARSITVLVTSQTPPSVSVSAKRQAREVNAILAGLGWPEETVRVFPVNEEPDSQWPRIDRVPEGESSGFKPATYAGIENKRAVLRAAIDHLVGQAANVPQEIPLPRGTPFGEVQVDKEKCTLCMGCVAVCPAGALLDNKERPCLSFIEWNCVQCGLCENTCPENAISLNARLIAESNLRMERRVLNEEEPFKCLGCGKPFTTQSMIQKMEEKLAGHRMFEGDGMRRLKLCEDCRVKDMFNEST